MVYPRIYGRLGNNVFQIMTCIAYSLKHNLEYHIPAHTINDEIYPPIITYLENKKFNPDLQTIRLKEQTQSYYELPFYEEWRNWNIELDGYWQSYTYFIDYLPQIRELFNLPCMLGFNRLTSLHIRRSDFLIYPSKHPCVNENYLDQAISIARDKFHIKLSEIVVSTDDLEWAKKFFKKRAMRVNYMEEFLRNISDDYYTDTVNWLAMQNCGNHILSNSTYSYTAAMFCDDENKKVICPHEDNWYGIDNKSISVENLLPKEWIRIKY